MVSVALALNMIKISKHGLNSIWKIEGFRDMEFPNLPIFKEMKVLSSFKILNQQKRKMNKKRKKVPNTTDSYYLNECDLPIGEKL